jgi:hypothetical protein
LNAGLNAKEAGSEGFETGLIIIIFVPLLTRQLTEAQLLTQWKEREWV